MFDSKPTEQLPLNGRNPLHLMALMLGVAGHASQATSRSGNVTFQVNGDRGRGIFTTLDGVDVSDPVIPRGENARVLLNPDSVGEYKVITSVPKAEYGRNSGAQVQVVSRSGTNQFHGNLFELHRNTIFNANDWFNNRSGILGVVGGRLVAAGLGQGYFRNPQFTTAALGCSSTNSKYNALQI